MTIPDGIPINTEIYFVTHADVQIDPDVPVPQWGLSAKGKARHAKFNDTLLALNITEIYCSGEQKAIDGALIMSERFDVSYNVVTGLHENDRSATGYLPPLEFEKTADEFFENPLQSVRGWEMASTAQQRIVSTIDDIVKNSSSEGSIAIVSHGGVGALLLCHLSNVPISRTMDQPGSGGGNYFVFNAATRMLVRGWENIDSASTAM